MPYCSQRTLNSSLSTNGRHKTQTSGSKVGEDFIGLRAALGSILAEAWDLRSWTALLGSTKGTLEGRFGRLGNISLLLARGNGGPDSGQLLTGAAAQQRGRGGRKGSHDQMTRLYERRDVQLMTIASSRSGVAKGQMSPRSGRRILLEVKLEVLSSPICSRTFLPPRKAPGIRRSLIGRKLQASEVTTQIAHGLKHMR